MSARARRPRRGHWLVCVELDGEWHEQSVLFDREQAYQQAQLVADAHRAPVELRWRYAAFGRAEERLEREFLPDPSLLPLFPSGLPVRGRASALAGAVLGGGCA